jgi:hypothetical protein
VGQLTSFFIKILNFYIMKTNLIRPLKLKSGVEFPIGTPVSVYPHLNDVHAQLFVDGSYEPVIIQMVNLFRYFPEFLEVSMESIDEAMMDGECPSMTGETGIEPDGHDSDGWPSILGVAGIIWHKEFS